MTSPEPLPAIGRPATRALAAIGVHSLDDVLGQDLDDLQALHGVGPKAIAILRAAVAERAERDRTLPE